MDLSVNTNAGQRVRGPTGSSRARRPSHVSLFTRLIKPLRLTAPGCRLYNRGMGELGRKEVWSDDDDILLKAWMSIYERPLTPPLTFDVVNAAGEAVTVSALDVNPDNNRGPWWEGWSCVFPITIRVRDIHG